MKANDEATHLGAPCRGCSASDLHPVLSAEEVVTHSGVPAFYNGVPQITLGVSVAVFVRGADDLTPARRWATG